MSLATVLLLAAVPRAASAEAVLSLVTSGSLSMVQGNTGTLSISVTNTGTSAIDLLGMTLGMQLVPNGSPTGSLTLSDFLAAGTVWSNPTLSPPTGATLQLGDLNGSSNYLSMAISGDPYTFAPSTTAVLGTVQFQASGDASGSWNLYVVNEWESEGFPVTFATDEETLAEVQFSNATATEGQLGVALQVGTVTVAVPEPSALALLGAAAAAAGLRLIRRRTASGSHP